MLLCGPETMDGQINDKDKVNLGNGTPDFTLGLNLGFVYKGFDFSIVANGAFGQQIVQSYRNHTRPTPNYTTAILDRWHGEGTSNRIPRVTDSNINYQFSDLFIQNGDYLRLSTLTLGYDFAKLFKGKAVSQARLYFQVQNLFTITGVRRYGSRNRFRFFQQFLGIGPRLWLLSAPPYCSCRCKS